jgi:hypothetical protein
MGAHVQGQKNPVKRWRRYGALSKPLEGFNMFNLTIRDLYRLASTGLITEKQFIRLIQSVEA